MAGLAAGDGLESRVGVGIGVRLLRVSVAAAPGTGVGSAPSSDAQLVVATVVSTSRVTATRAGILAV
jgi:hypothetical protein